MRDLKPCPFCGNKNPQTVVDDETETKFGVCCFKCEAQISATFEERDEAEVAWNRRAEPEEDEDE